MTARTDVKTGKVYVSPADFDKIQQVLIDPKFPNPGMANYSALRAVGVSMDDLWARKHRGFEIIVDHTLSD